MLFGNGHVDKVTAHHAWLILDDCVLLDKLLQYVTIQPSQLRVLPCSGNE